MVYERPKLVMALGSTGGYLGMWEVMDSVDPEAMKKGTIYFIEHEMYTSLYKKMFDRIGIYLDENTVRGDTLLENGRFYMYPGVFVERDKRVHVLSLHKTVKDEIIFLESEIPRKKRFMPGKKVMDFNIDQALKAGYGDDMMVVFLSGFFNDGCYSIERAKKRGVKTLIQAPKTALKEEMPVNANGKVNVGFRTPEEIGLEINGFLS
ncbi:MAG: hypothetical protein JW754_00675 [Candidatus Aenigmarchaeota archaeon]|nr:hypothetical protein [Candidatus Aenigmarchaeota archaeon]